MSSNSKSAARRRRLERIARRRNYPDRSSSKLEQLVANSVSQLEPEPKPEDLELFKYDLLAWGQRFLPHHFKHPPSKMHIEIAAILDADARRRDEELRAEAARNDVTTNSRAPTDNPSNNAAPKNAPSQ